MDEGRAALLLLRTDGLRHTRSTLLALLCCAVSLRRSKRSSSFWRGFPSIYRVTSAQAGRKEERGERGARKEGLLFARAVRRADWPHTEEEFYRVVS